MARRFLVTGGAGFIGSHLVDALRARGDVVVVLDNLSTGARDNLASASEVQLIEGDLNDSAALQRALAGVDTVIHTARRISERSLDERVPVKKQVDEIDQLAITFNQMLDRIQKLVTEIKEMNDNIAHDLKSPITRIRGIAEVSLTTESTLQDYENMAGNTIEECDRLLNMINTMLIISKTEAGLGQFENKELDIAKVVQDACELFLPMAEIEGLTLVCDTLDRLITNGDIRMVQRMISNLIDNAVKYTPAGGKIEVTALSDGRQSIRISIKDSGRGISEKDLPHIFERFYRGRSNRTDGSGLGLAIVKSVVQAHGGRVWVESEPGAGSRFLIEVPFQPSHQA